MAHAFTIVLKVSYATNVEPIRHKQIECPPGVVQLSIWDSAWLKKICIPNLEETVLKLANKIYAAMWHNRSINGGKDYQAAAMQVNTGGYQYGYDQGHQGNSGYRGTQGYQPPQPMQQYYPAQQRQVGNAPTSNPNNIPIPDHIRPFNHVTPVAQQLQVNVTDSPEGTISTEQLMALMNLNQDGTKKVFVSIAEVNTLDKPKKLRLKKKKTPEEVEAIAVETRKRQYAEVEGSGVKRVKKTPETSVRKVLSLKKSQKTAPNTCKEGFIYKGCD
jgi:hypothetical protein